MSIMFRKKYTAAQMQEQLEAFDDATSAMEVRRTEIRRQVPNLAARESLGELSKDESKDLRALRDELAAIYLDTRTATRAVLRRALEAAEADEARARRVAQIAEARAWQKRIDAATDDATAAVRSLTDKLEALQKAETEMPDCVNALRPSTAPTVGGWLVRFRYYLEPDHFGQAINALDVQKGILGQVLQEIEAGVPSRQERRAVTGLPA
jgi:hypothetical protein